MKDLTVRIQRFDPDKDKEPYFRTYTVKVNDGARVLHVLHAIHDTLDPTLSYRYSCASGQCGSLCGAGERRAGAGLHGGGKGQEHDRADQPPGEKGPRLRPPAKTGADRLVPAEEGDRPPQKAGHRHDQAPPGLHRMPLLPLGLPGRGRDEIPRPDRDAAGDAARPRPPRQRRPDNRRGPGRPLHLHQLPGLLEGLPQGDRDPRKSDRETPGLGQQAGLHPAPAPRGRGAHQGNRTERPPDRGIVPRAGARGHRARTAR